MCNVPKLLSTQSKLYKQALTDLFLLKFSLKQSL